MTAPVKARGGARAANPQLAPRRPSAAAGARSRRLSRGRSTGRTAPPAPSLMVGPGAPGR